MDCLKNYFKKNIEREIKAVVKVDDELNMKQELEEYVVTTELLKHFQSIFTAFDNELTHNSQKIGVWISGFFGSGKSHFLKILSYLLENRMVGDKYAVEYFNDKIEDNKLLDTIKKVAQVPSDVILFDIDTKAGKKKNEQIRLVDIFEKVFNEKLGLSTTPFVAEIERNLIKAGKYEEFVQEFNNCNVMTWEKCRNGLQFVADKFVEVYSKVMSTSKEEARGVIDLTERTYSLDIKTFAQRVREYIESKGNNRHVYFLVDEIGQYIGDNRNLILNLQTIEQELEIECGGKAWLMVTSQQAIDDVVKVVGNDFSKIQGRFDTLLNLSSSDIEEVIKKRILDKKEEYKESLELLYEKDESIINNLLTFKNAAYQKSYKDKTDFAQTYPFIPYQFVLLQNVFTNIRKQGYAGKAISSGERSLLGSIQLTTIDYRDYEEGTLIPFYAFYNTIDKYLEFQIKNVIKVANDAVTAGVLTNTDINVLKILFMLKNIKEIPANIDNIATLYVSNINDDKLSIKKEITDSLRKLENQTLIQRNNEEYKFLTDEEQEINREIKQIVIDQNRITDYLNKIIYGYIYTDNKFTYKGKNFPITKYVDNMKFSQEYDIGIKVISSQVGRDDTDIIIQSSAEKKYIYIKLELSTLIYSEIETCLQVEEYKRSKSGILQTTQIEDILRTKQREVEAAEGRIKNNVREQLNEAEIMIAGDRQNINSKDAKSRINEALEILVNNIYNKFSYIKKNYTTQDIRELWNINKQVVLANEVEFLNQKAYEAMQDYIQQKNEFNLPITIRTLLQDFNAAPYGFLDDDILYLLARLLKTETVSLYYSSEIQNITSEDTLNKILKREYYDRTIIKMRKKIDIQYINNLKSVARNSFNEINLSDNEDGMVKDFKEKCLTPLIESLKEILGYYHNIKTYQYPGKETIEKAIQLFRNIDNLRDVSEVFEEVTNKKEEISEITPKIDRIVEFFKGSQKEQFDKIRETLTMYDNNKDYVDQNKELQEIVEQIVNILTAEEPYNKIHELPTLRTKLINMLLEMYEVKSAPIIQMANSVIEYVQNEVQSVGLDIEQFGKEYIQNCKGIINSLQHSNELKDIYAQETRLLQMKDAFIIALDQKKYKLEEHKYEDLADTQEEQTMARPRKIVRTDMLMNRSYEINSKEDIEKYIQELKSKLLKELDENSNLIIK